MDRKEGLAYKIDRNQINLDRSWRKRFFNFLNFFYNPVKVSKDRTPCPRQQRQEISLLVLKLSQVYNHSIAVLEGRSTETCGSYSFNTSRRIGQKFCEF